MTGKDGSTPLRVLIIEDSPDDTELMLHELRRGGFDPIIERVEDRASMNAALSRSWDVVLADYNLPRFGAADALELLHADGRDIPFLIVSGSIGEETAVASMHAGASDYIMKDKIGRLVPAIQRELREAESRRARRDAERALRESEARYRMLVEHTSDIITMARVDGTVLYQSPSVKRILGYQPEEWVGRMGLELVHPDDLPGMRAALEALVAGARGPAVFVVRCLHRDGSWRVLEVISTLMEREAGNPVVVSAARDVTDRRMLEDQLRQSQKMEAIGRLAGGVAHDFNNLLTVITGYTELLLEQLRDDARRADVDEIRKAAERAASLTRQLLAFSRRQVLAPRMIDLNEVVTRMETMLRRVIGEDIELVTVLGKGLGAVRADPNQLESVIVNLAVNARDAMPEGGRLTLETARVQIGETYSRQHLSMPPGPYVMLAVGDTGVGMDAATRAHLFEPFFTTKEQGKGTGLGLSTVYGIVKQSGGHIWVYSEPGHGTTFKIYLPRVNVEADAVADRPDAGELPHGHGTVLLVEDEDLVRNLTREILERHGYSVLVTRHAAEALAVARSHAGHIDLMLTDMVMPGLGGRELADRIRATRAEMKILYVSGHTERGIIRDGVLDPAAAFLQKPFTPEALVRKVHDVLTASGPGSTARVTR
jgi:PAS domain S-box-containing protein